MRVALAVLLVTAALGGCTLGPESKGSGASLTVTRDFGAKPIVRANEEDLPEGETAMRILQRHADVDTRYGGRFVTAIEGVRSSSSGGTRRDWLYFVNGIEEDVGAAEKRLEPGDRVWWDYRDWTGALRVPAVVGSYPEPFLHGSEGKRYPVRIDCAKDASDACGRVADRLEEAGVPASTTAIGAPAGKEVLRLVVGQWPQVRQDPAAQLVEEGPARSGVFARFGPGSRGIELLLLDDRGRAQRSLREGVGLVAATRFEEQVPTWVVTGTDADGVEAAVRLLSERALRDHFAVASDGADSVPLPLRGAGGAGEGG